MGRGLVVLVLGLGMVGCSNGSVHERPDAAGGTAGTGTAGTGSAGGSAGVGTAGTLGVAGDVGAAGEAGAAGMPGTAGAAGAIPPDAAVEVPSDAIADAVSGDAPPVDAGADRSVDAAPGDADAASGDADATSGDGAAETGADAPLAQLVTVGFTGQVVTVASAPLGLDASARLAPVSGSFTYDLRLIDQLPLDPLRARYDNHFATTAFTFVVKGHVVTGSGDALVEIENLDPDTFRFLDGPQGDGVPRTMKLDGVDDPSLKLTVAITDGTGATLKFTSDALPDPFPTFDITTLPHTFSLADAGGTLLMQLATLTPQ